MFISRNHFPPVGVISPAYKLLVKPIKGLTVTDRKGQEVLRYFGRRVHHARTSRRGIRAPLLSDWTSLRWTADSDNSDALEICLSSGGGRHVVRIVFHVSNDSWEIDLEPAGRFG